MTKERLWRNSRGAYRTSDLFYEMNTSEYPSYYTIKTNDHTVDGVTYPSLKRLYLEEEDITEFDFANKYFDGFEHWERFANSPRTKPYVDQWRKELVLKIKARCLKGIIHDAVKDNKYEANKFLITNGWVDKDTEGKKVRGRPSKEEIKQELYRQAEVEKELEEDLNRIRELN